MRTSVWLIFTGLTHYPKAMRILNSRFSIAGSLFPDQDGCPFCVLYVFSEQWPKPLWNALIHSVFCTINGLMFQIFSLLRQLFRPAENPPQGLDRRNLDLHRHECLQSQKWYLLKCGSDLCRRDLHL